MDSKLTVLKDSQAFSGFSVDDIDQADDFYKNTLGLTVENMPMGLQIKLANGNHVFVYPKPDHQPASFTILNFPVPDLDEAVDGLVAAGITMEQYDNPDMPQDDKGIMRNDDPDRGPVGGIAWFKDPAGNVLSVLQY